MKNTTRRLLVVLSGLCLLATACGGEATSTSPAQPTTMTTSTTQTPTTPTTPTAIEDGGDGTDHGGTGQEDSMADGGTVEADHVILVTIAGGEVRGVADRIAVAVGSTVAITATSDVTDEIHIHGFNQFLKLTPGVEATLTFTANAPGLFEVELEKAGTFLFELEVGP